ncbi:MAG: hypothetical protein J6386_16405 [Candidatus Synoicihabitans palmerolidicus]|nr:hypothetical protein [Candidatus Synoicihabitans palmerolidicus]
MPTNTSLDLEVSLGDEISVSDVSGDVTIKNLNGEVELHNLCGGAIIESLNGEIATTFAELTPDKPISFTSLNDEVEVRLPADAQANVRYRFQNGSILTDFDDTVLVTTTSTGPAFAPGFHEEFGEVAREIAQETVEIGHEIAEAVRAAINDNRKSKGNIELPRAPRPPKSPAPPASPPWPAAKSSVVPSTAAALTSK